jgi:hypothetical protein
MREETGVPMPKITGTAEWVKIEPEEKTDRSTIATGDRSETYANLG